MGNALVIFFAVTLCGPALWTVGSRVRAQLGVWSVPVFPFLASPLLAGALGFVFGAEGHLGRGAMERFGWACLFFNAATLLVLTVGLVLWWLGSAVWLLLEFAWPDRFDRERARVSSPDPAARPVMSR